MVPIPEGVEAIEEDPPDEAFQGITGSGGNHESGRIHVVIGKFDELRG